MTNKQQEYLKKVLDKNSKEWKEQKKEVYKSTAMIVDFLRYIDALPKDIEETYTKWVDNYTKALLIKKIQQLSNKDIECLDFFKSVFENTIN